MGDWWSRSILARGLQIVGVQTLNGGLVALASLVVTAGGALAALMMAAPG